jgi:hypothetical protein
MMTSQWAEPASRYCEPPRANGYVIAWRELANMTRVLRFRQQLRHVHLLATRCAACIRRPGHGHRPCFALDCRCPCSTQAAPGLAGSL